MNDDPLIRLAQRLVQQKGFASEEKAVAETVATEMRRLGYDTVTTDRNGSVVGTIEGRTSGPTLLFDAHIDTVPIPPEAAWTHDPFGASIENGFLLGRGAADMKGALAAMLVAAADCDRKTLHGQIVVSASVLEEVLEGVALKTVMEATQPDFVVIGEATNLNLSLGGRGRAEIRLETQGIAAHTSSPQEGRNAVLAMLKVIEVIEAMPAAEHPLLGPVIYALTDIISQPYPGHSVVPSRCVATYDQRLHPGETEKSVLRSLRENPLLEALPLSVEIPQGSYQAYTGQLLEARKFFPAWEIEPDHPLVVKAMAGLASAGLQPEQSGYRFCTNAAYSAGVAGIPTIGFGPAREEDAHVVDERLAIDQLVAAAQGYGGIIQAVLGQTY